MDADPATDRRELQALLDEQLAYYRARAREYDDWWLRRGRYDRGEAANQRWRSEVAELRAALDEPAVLERRLSAMGYDAAVRGTREFFLQGAGGRP